MWQATLEQYIHPQVRAPPPFCLPQSHAVSSRADGSQAAEAGGFRLPLLSHGIRAQDLENRG